MHSEKSECLREKIHGSSPGDLGGGRVTRNSQVEHLFYLRNCRGKGKGAAAQAGEARTPHSPSQAGQRCQLRITESIRLERSSEIIESNP